MYSEHNKGYYSAIFAYFWWGLIPIYFKLLTEVNAMEILAHRVIWCVPSVLLIMLAFRKRFLIRQVWQNKTSRLALLGSTILVLCNWFVFTWAVINDQVLATSLGYYINPLFSIVLGVFFLQEKMSKYQLIAVLLATLGVLNQIIFFGELPWISLALALTFGLYGLLKKQTAVDSTNGLLFETIIAMPVALVFVAYLFYSEQGDFLNGDMSMNWILVAGGMVTAVPLILFAYGARLIPLYAIGFLQFIAPTMTFILAVLIYKEPFGWQQGITFALIWLALTIYLLDSIFHRVKKMRWAK